jgi:hypothetical protein
VLRHVGSHGHVHARSNNLSRRPRVRTKSHVCTYVHRSLRETQILPYINTNSTAIHIYESYVCRSQNTVQLLQLKNRLDWQEKLSGMPLHQPEGVSIAEYVTAKYKAGHRRAYLSMALIMFLYTALVVGYATSSPVYFRGCTGCLRSREDFALLSGTIVFCLGWIFFALMRVPKPVAGQPMQYSVHQLRVQFKYFFPVYVGYVVLSILDLGDLHKTGLFAWNNLVTMLMMVLVFYTTAYPGLHARWKTLNAPTLRLLDVIQDPVLLGLFESHLKSEFLLENLRFYFEATMLRRNFPAGKFMCMYV